MDAVEQLRASLTRLGPALVEGAAGAGIEVDGLRRLSGGASQQTWSFDLRRSIEAQAGAAGQALPDDVAPKAARMDAGTAPAQGSPVLRAILRRGGIDGRQRDSGSNAGLAAEAALMRAVARVGVPVPVVRHVLTATDGIGDGFIMERLEGETLGRRIATDPGFAAARERLAHQCGVALARIHMMKPEGLPPLRVAGAGGELQHYRDTHRRHGTIKPVFELALRWLADHLPPEPSPGSARLVHGDFRNGNLMVDGQGLVAVLDWELAHFGDPMEDLGWLCVNSWRFGVVDRPVGGFGTREQLFAGYESVGGVVDPEGVHFWEILGTLKWGIMCERLAGDHLSGADPSVEKAAIGRRSSETEIDLLTLLAPRAA